MSRSPAAHPPATLLVAGVVEAVEGVGLLVLAALAIAAGPGSAYPTTAYGAGGTLVVVAALLLAVAVGTLRMRPWSRTAGMVWQALQLLVGLYAFQGDGAQPGLGAVAIVPAVVVIVLLFTPSARIALDRA